jgi:hypothetical protein
MRQDRMLRGIWAQRASSHFRVINLGQCHSHANVYRPFPALQSLCLTLWPSDGAAMTRLWHGGRQLCPGARLFQHIAPVRIVLSAWQFHHCTPSQQSWPKGNTFRLHWPAADEICRNSVAGMVEPCHSLPNFFASRIFFGLHIFAGI